MAPTKAATFRIPDKCNIAVEENAEVWKQKYESEKNSHLSVFRVGPRMSTPITTTTKMSTPRMSISQNIYSQVTNSQNL